MTKREYSDYKAKVAAFHRQNDLRPGLSGPASDRQEPFFSWRPCDCCGSKLGGNRETYLFSGESHGPLEADICADCVHYLAYGRLDDATMLEIEESESADNSRKA